MELDSLVAMAKANGASDLHLEPGLPAAIRVRGTLKATGAPLPGKMLLEAAHELIGAKEWNVFLERRSFDLSRNIEGTRCRINVMQTSRGVGMAIRLLMGFTATVDKLNLHPDIRKLIGHTHGLIIISGATGSGKSSTMAALIQEINLLETRHVVTIESPIEYLFKPHRAYIRQREVGRDTPSFEQALLDAMREDPDVLMVGGNARSGNDAVDVERGGDGASGIGNCALGDSSGGVATGGGGVSRGEPEQCLRATGGLFGGGRLPAVAVSAGFADSGAGVRDLDSVDACDEKFYPSRGVF